jgi:hypothetical protein
MHEKTYAYYVRALEFANITSRKIHRSTALANFAAVVLEGAQNSERVPVALGHLGCEPSMVMTMQSTIFWVIMPQALLLSSFAYSATPERWRWYGQQKRQWISELHGVAILQRALFEFWQGFCI